MPSTSTRSCTPRRCGASPRRPAGSSTPPARWVTSPRTYATAAGASPPWSSASSGTCRSSWSPSWGWHASSGATGASSGWSSPMLKVFLLIVVGLAGDPEHGKTFHTWGTKLAETSERLGVASERLVYLVDEPAADDKRVTGRATREEVAKALEGFAKQATPDDVVIVTLIGHGSFDGRSPKFNMPGPDMGPADFAALLKKLPAKQVVFVNTSSSSGPFVDELSGPGRTIVTATRNGAEQFATLFGGFFVDALTSETADADKNRRVSVLEAFLYAKAEVERAYKREGLLQTEHALLDDD